MAPESLTISDSALGSTAVSDTSWGSISVSDAAVGILPFTLPLANQLAWWSANGGLYADTGLTTPANNGDTVKGWKDQGPTGYHVTQSAAGANQVYIASLAALNKQPAVQFLNSGFLIKTGLAAGIVANLNVYTIYVVFATTDTVSAAYMYSEGNSGTATQFAAVRHNLQAIEGFHRSDASVSANPSGGTTAANGAAHILTLRRIASNSWSLRQDGIQVATATNAPGTTTINQVALGVLARSTNGQFYTGYLAQVALYSADNFATIEPLLAGFYGITLP